MDFTDQQVEAIKRFVASDEFLEIKDTFVSHTPEGGNDGTKAEGDSKNLGKLLGTRYVFNEMQKIARAKPKTKPKAERDRTGNDPDLDTETS